MTEDAGKQLVQMRHPKSGPLQTVTREAFDMIHAPKGWELVEADAAVALELTDGQAEDLSKLSKADLEALAGRAGVVVPEGSTKAEIITLIEASRTPA